MVLSGRKVVALTLAVVGVVIAAAVGFVYSGSYDMAADTPHTRVVHRLLTVLRERSVARHAQGIAVPTLDDPDLRNSGAGNYDAMCASCHLAPGIKASELSRGLYPAPPRLDDPQRAHTPAQDFWIIKHGIKASGMPAWGRSMDDRYIWGMVAFLQQLPGLTPEQYARMVAASPGHRHGGGESPAESEHVSHGDGHHHEHPRAETPEHE
jgi:mono/diheme cytochrome c family protein